MAQLGGGSMLIGAGMPIPLFASVVAGGTALTGGVGGPHRTLLGVIIITWIRAGMLMLAIVGWGDGIAPYIGKKWGKRKFKTLGREKSIEGSIGVFLFSIFGCLIFLFLLGIIGGPYDSATSVLHYPGVDLTITLLVIIVLSFIATIVEALSPADIDNLSLPASTIIALFIIDFLLGSQFLFLSF